MNMYILAVVQLLKKLLYLSLTIYRRPKNALQSAQNRISQQKADYAAYNPKEIQRLDNAIVKNTGRYLIVCVSEGDTAKKIIGEYTN